MKISKILSNVVWLLIVLIGPPASAGPLGRGQDYTVMISTVLVPYKNKAIERERYAVGEPVQVKVVMTNASTQTLNVPKGEDYYRPQLFRYGQLVAYRKEVSERIEKLGAGTGARITGFFFLKPNEPQSDTIDLDYWYGPLEAGHYQLTLQRIFFKQRAESNAVLFEVVPQANHIGAACTRARTVNAAEGERRRARRGANFSYRERTVRGGRAVRDRRPYGVAARRP